MTELRFPDVSHYQGTIDWVALAAQLRQLYGAAVAGIKATQSGAVDPMLAANRDGARAAGFDLIIFYDYLSAGADPAASARALVAAVGTWAPNEVACCDLEEGTGDQSGRLDQWNSALTLPEIDYSGDSFWRTQLAGARTALHRWDAAYRATDPALPGEVAWQDTDAAIFAGIAGPCDQSIVPGGIAQLRAALFGTITPPPATTGGFLMALTDQQQTDLYNWVRQLVLVATDTDNVAHQAALYAKDADDLAHRDATADPPPPPPPPPIKPGG